MCSGRPPFRGRDARWRCSSASPRTTPRPIREIIPEVPQWLVRLIARLHAKEPAERFQTAAEAAGVLEDCLRQMAAGDTPSVPVAAPSRRRPRETAPSRRGWGTALGVTVTAVAVVAAVGAFLALGGADQRELTADPGAGLVKTPEQPPPQEPPKFAPRPRQPRPPLTREELDKLPSPLDGRKRADIAPELLALAGGGDPEKAPAEVVAVFGNAGTVHPSPLGHDTHAGRQPGREIAGCRLRQQRGPL